MNSTALSAALGVLLVLASAAFFFFGRRVGRSVERERQSLAKATAEPHNWLMYWGDYHATHYSPLSQITAANVNELRTACQWPIDAGGDNFGDCRFQHGAQIVPDVYDLQQSRDGFFAKRRF